MDEAGFKSAIRKKLDRSIFTWGINARFAVGAPDCWYSGPAGDLWVEYKYLKRTPTRRFTPKLSAPQKHWLLSRRDEGRNVAVITGCPDGVFIQTGPDIGGAVMPDSLQNRRHAIYFIETHCADNNQ